MPSHRGFKAWISCEGEPLTEYEKQIDPKEPDIVTCWVPSKAGANFSVCWQNDNKKKTATSGHVFIDGNDVASAIMRPERKSHVERSGAKTSSSNIRQFKFAALELTDDDNIAPRVDPSAQHIGTIRLEITRVILGAEVPFQATNVENRGPVHERAKKAGVHVTKFGATQRSAKGKSAAVSNAPYDHDRTTPWVTFVFRYRSHDFLMAQNIIPNPLKRRATPQTIVIDSDDDEEANESPANKRIKLEAQEAFAREAGYDDDFLASQAPAASSPPKTDTASSPVPATGNTQLTPESTPEPAQEPATMVEESQTQDESQPTQTQDPSQTQDDESMGDETLIG
ncbi:hypothetical protein AURDEDRAFT_161127 [Auricularia subglabra TFB-10046 SS5]|nr:hypothetical protein AURDEDRAFT_161127 [Auricularia subglabra TFB-10046 SS5]